MTMMGVGMGKILHNIEFATYKYKYLALESKCEWITCILNVWAQTRSLLVQVVPTLDPTLEFDVVETSKTLLMVLETAAANFHRT